MDRTIHYHIRKHVERLEEKLTQMYRRKGMMQPHEVLKLEFWIDHIPVPVELSEEQMDMPILEFLTEERIGRAGVNKPFYVRNLQTVMRKYQAQEGRILYVRDLKTIDFKRFQKIYMAGEKTVHALKTVLCHYKIT